MAELQSTGLTSAQQQGIADIGGSLLQTGTTIAGAALSARERERNRAEARKLADVERSDFLKSRAFQNATNEKELKMQEEELEFNKNVSDFELRLKSMFHAIDRRRNRKQSLYESAMRLKNSPMKNQLFRVMKRGDR